jgi:hypothetical protein
MISRAGSSGIFDNLIHFNVDKFEFAIFGCELDQEMVMFLQSFFQIANRLLLSMPLIRHICDQIDRNVPVTLLMNFNEGFHIG